MYIHITVNFKDNTERELEWNGPSLPSQDELFGFIEVLTDMKRSEISSLVLAIVIR